MKAGGWRRQGAIAATTLALTLWASEPVFAQTSTPPTAVPAATAAPEQPASDSRWRRFVGATGVVSYVDKQSLHAPADTGSSSQHTVQFQLLRNVLPDFTIKTADGEPIRSSVKQVVLDCAQRTYTVIAQTLYRARNASGKPLYQIRYGDDAQSRSLREGSVFEWIAGRFCAVPHP
ncbi:surface-adhesin E family protein (plasmid) [Ralstonia sp. 25C]|uniref:surface-adhesin E family protein n=1 Tax=Ralstonia sp. 25C TaxID=3447363 RepID=UPI003F754E6C